MTQPAAGAATLIVTTAAGVQRHELIAGRQYVIGRADDCDLVIRELFVSRRHAELVPTAQGWNYRHLGGANPTLRQGQPVTDSPLLPGELYEILGPDGARVTIALETAAPAAPVEEMSVLIEIPSATAAATDETPPLPPRDQSPDLAVTASPADMRVRAGSQAVYSVTVENRTATAQSLSFELDGLPPDWVSIDFDETSKAFPGEKRSGTLIINIPADAPSSHRRFYVVGWAGAAQSSTVASLEVVQSAAAAARETPVPGVSLMPATITVDSGGGDQPLGLTIRNVSAIDTEYTLTVSGLADGWYVVTERVQVPAREAVDAGLRLRPPAGSPAGTYAFTVHAAVAHAPHISGAATGELRIGVAAPDDPAQRTAPVAVAARDASSVRPPEIALGPSTDFHFDQVEVSHQAVLTLRNEGRLMEVYDIVVDGVPSHWYTPPGDVRIDPGASVQVPLQLHPRSDADHPAGVYPFTVRVAPAGYPDSAATVSGQLTIEGTHTIDAYIDPTQSRGREASYRVVVRNTGNTRMTVNVRELDMGSEGRLQLTFQPPGELQPGEERVMPLFVDARRSDFFGPPHEFEFGLQLTAVGGSDTEGATVVGSFTHTPRTAGCFGFFGTIILVAFALPLLGLSLPSFGRRWRHRHR